MKILFLDIETVPEYKTFDELPEDGKKCFTRKFGYKVASGQYMDMNTAYDAEAALHAEFAKIVCICIGSVKFTNGEEVAYLKTFTGEETDILNNFKAALEKFCPEYVCAHRGKQFDFPFLGRRMLKHCIDLPSILDVAGKKPWEVFWLDTAEIWSFTDRSHYVSLSTLAYVFGIPSPKQDLDGAMVPAAFYAGEIVRIATYCAGDVITLINSHRRMSGLPVIQKQSIVS